MINNIKQLLITLIQNILTGFIALAVILLGFFGLCYIIAKTFPYSALVIIIIFILFVFYSLGDAILNG